MTTRPLQRGVLVTGAAEGIGRGIAGAFAEAGDRVALLDVDEKKLGLAVDELQASGGQVFGLPVDVRDSRAVAAAVEQAVARLDRLDVTVSNAGGYPNRPVLEMDEHEWDRVLDTDLKG